MRKLLKRISSLLGYKVTITKTNRKPGSNSIIGFNSEYLSSISNPDIVIDVGVGYGTWPLYQAYPNAHFVLIEPLMNEFAETIEKIKNNYSCEVFGNALGENKGKLELNFDTKNMQKASLFERTAITKNSGTTTTKSVDVTTLDKILEGMELSDKVIILKIDTEGGELSVLKGGISSLKEIDYVIAEVSIIKRFESSYEFEELIEFMSQHGFKVYSFLTMDSPVNEQRQRFTDILFKNIDKNKGIS